VIRISETVSVKRKRGRPRAAAIDELTGADLTAWRLFTYDVPPTATRRTWRNYELAFWAYVTLLELDGTGAVDWASAHPTVLTELGRIGNQDRILDCARMLSERKPTARQAVAWLKELKASTRRDEILTALGVRAPDHRPEKGDNLSPLPKTTADVAAELGMDERTAQRRKPAHR